MSDLSDYSFSKVMDYPDDPEAFYIFDFSGGYDEAFIREQGWGIGRYNEERTDMYNTPLFDGRRNIHMGIDIWASAGEPVFSFWEGLVVYKQQNDNDGDYGPTIVIKYNFDNEDLFALYGHLSRESLEMVKVGGEIAKGQQIATLGSEKVNGGWEPHLHFQLSVDDPKEADMPGVVSEKNREEALEKYPDPRIILGDLY
ncbi:Peptidase family M23 [Fodinibius salinus]|uniref:Peptidase family M23 n=1 Tax=Fodinibius salinus TaxID=860790 RepID=A0A5D3YJ53_9BACT|nr:peptidoglycan DD-metalloendopeptidase family protein [Fodinibius salinus]TYP92765.1 Peptidase family M23 [Fodinibius salinus]